MIDANLTFAFTAGIVATVNPCGFAMLPAYLSFFLGVEGQRSNGSATTSRASMGRALTTGLTVSLGFLLVFGVVGVLVTLGLGVVRDVVPWITMVIGAALVVLGGILVAGGRLSVTLPKLERGGESTELRSLFIFGVSYAVASISCGLPTFIVVVSTSVGDVQSGLASFAAYALGMAVVLMSLTVSLALARQSLLRRLRSLMRYVDRIAGVLMVLAGLYLLWFWITERLGTSQGGVALQVDRWSSQLSNWVNDLGGIRVGVALSIVVALGAIGWLWNDGSEPAGTAGTEDV